MTHIYISICNIYEGIEIVSLKLQSTGTFLRTQRHVAFPQKSCSECSESCYPG